MIQLNDAEKYFLEYEILSTRKYFFLCEEKVADKFWEELFNIQPELEQKIKNELKKRNIDYNEENFIFKLIEITELYNKPPVSDEKMDFIEKLVEIIRNNENLLNEIILQYTNVKKIIKKEAERFNFRINYFYLAGYIFPDGSILDINMYNHSAMPYKYLCENGIITYRTYKKNLYVRFIKDRVTYKQKKSLEELIKLGEIVEIHYDVYNKDGDLIKNGSVKIFGHEYIKIFEKKNINRKRKIYE